MTMKKHYIFCSVFFSSFSICWLTSCKKFVEVDLPINAISASSIFQNDANATSAILSIYSNMMQGSDKISSGSRSAPFLTGLLSDELNNYSLIQEQAEFFNNSILPTNEYVRAWWEELYDHIYNANSVLEGLEKPNGVSTQIKSHLIGEAKFLRAYCYFYLVNLYGDVPLITQTDFRKNRSANRVAKSIVYEQVISDLTDAKNMLNEEYLSGNNQFTNERQRINKFAACALLARTHLFLGNWADAEAEASLVINHSETYKLVSLDEVFLKNSLETIWQLSNDYAGTNTWEGENYILSEAPSPANSTRNTTISDNLLDAFHTLDNRKVSWVNSITAAGESFYFPFKYKIGITGDVHEYLMMFRLAELYLIRAESKVNLGDIIGGQDDLNAVRNRAGLPNTLLSEPNQLLDAIINERQVELFTEGGHRWLDLKRSARIDEVLSGIKDSWQTTDQLLPIPQSEFVLNPDLGTQNPGY